MGKDRKISKAKEFDSDRETRVLLEEIRHEVKTVAEGHSAIMRKLDGHDQRFDNHDQRFDRIEMVVSDINLKVNVIEKKLDENIEDHEHRIKKLEEKALI